MSWGASRDKNEKEIVAFLRKKGCTVSLINEPGVPDLLVGYENRNYLIEVKRPGRKLTPRQVTWHKEWEGDVFIATTAKEAWDGIVFRSEVF